MDGSVSREWLWELGWLVMAGEEMGMKAVVGEESTDWAEPRMRSEI